MERIKVKKTVQSTIFPPEILHILTILKYQDYTFIKRIIHLLLILIIFYSVGYSQDITYYNIGESIIYDSIPYMVKDSAFHDSFAELKEMFNAKTDYNLKRAEFLVENAYYEGRINYKDYCDQIDSIVKVLNNFIDLRNIRQYKTAPNFAIFEYFTKPSFLNGYKNFTYDFENSMGQNDFSVFFISNLIHTHKGQCTSMPLLYKILCDELGGNSSLAFGPMHLYIKHIGEDGQWVNVELTHGGFVRDVWMMETMNISTEAIRNGVFLCALNEKETVGFMLMQLARAYVNKYGNYDFFVNMIIETVLKDLPNFCDALVMKLNYIQFQGNNFKEKYDNWDSPFQIKLYTDFQNLCDKLDRLGYTQLTLEEYNSNIEKASVLQNHKR